jgi:hypothetical protein
MARVAPFLLNAAGGSVIARLTNRTTGTECGVFGGGGPGRISGNTELT